MIPRLLLLVLPLAAGAPGRVFGRGGWYERVKLVNEIIQGMRVVKLYAWEEALRRGGVRKVLSPRANPACTLTCCTRTCPYSSRVLLGVCAQVYREKYPFATAEKVRAAAWRGFNATSAAPAASAR